MGHPVNRTKSLGLLKREKIEDKNLTEFTFNPYVDISYNRKQK